MAARARTDVRVLPPRGDGRVGLSRSFFDTFRAPKGLWRIAAPALVAGLLAGGAVMAGLTGGSGSPLVHFMYVPILVSAVFYGTAGGLLTATVAGLIVSPWMPDGTGDAYVSAWVVTTAFFGLVGGVGGRAQHLLAERLSHGETLVEKLATVHARTLTTFASATDIRDRSTGGHSARVAHNARAVAVGLDLDEESVRTVYWAGLLHDLGKLGVPERILQKPGKLTPEEIAVMRRHSNLGASLLLSVSPDLRPIAEGVRAHHERWDGTGYPLGISGHAIPLAGRILTVVDVFEALTCARPYRRPSLAGDALAYLRDHAGVQFDPAVVSLFEDLYWRGAVHTVTDLRAALKVEEPTVLSEEHLEPLLTVAARVGAYHSGSSGRP